ncbi:MAG: hypothetical protein JXR97_12750, partial [Planctomycetes bacterium]|nr:hypothetical protein [Planctomycetota bacterium]
GIITAADHSTGSMQIDFSTNVQAEPGAAYILAFDTPEIKRPLRLAGEIADASTQTYDGQSAYTKATMVNIQTGSDILEFLCAGSIIESERSWIEMKRK